MRRCARDLTAWLGEGGVDLIHTHYRRATFLARRVQPRLRRLGVVPPVLYTLHLSHLRVDGWRRLLSDFGDHTHAASADAVDWLVREARVPARRVSLVSHGVDTGHYRLRTDADRAVARAALGVPADVPVAAFVGRFDHPKNEGWCLDTLCRPAAPSNLHLLYAGEGPREPLLRETIRRKGLSQRVRLLGHVDPLPVYQAADLLLLPSEREGFSLVCAEAMAVGVPHVRTLTSGATELTIEGETGWAVPINRGAFAAATLEALEDRERLERMGLAWAVRVREHFTFERQVERTLAMYATLTGRA